jgi:hypothetical protein
MPTFSKSERRHSDEPPSISRMAAFCFGLLFVVGCTHQPPRAATQPYVDLIDAQPTPPAGWISRVVEVTPDSTHIVWTAPSGRTAYGVIHFKLPLPVGYDLALWGFLLNMKNREGEAALLSKEWDPNLQCLRFVAVGGVYRIRTNLFVSGQHGWAIYAGTLRKEEINPEELKLAELAREQTMTGR